MKCFYSFVPSSKLFMIRTGWSFCFLATTFSTDLLAMQPRFCIPPKGGSRRAFLCFSTKRQKFFGWLNWHPKKLKCPPPWTLQYHIQQLHALQSCTYWLQWTVENVETTQEGAGNPKCNQKLGGYIEKRSTPTFDILNFYPRGINFFCEGYLWNKQGLWSSDSKWSQRCPLFLTDSTSP